jgi:hypothetical protein
LGIDIHDGARLTPRVERIWSVVDRGLSKVQAACAEPSATIRVPRNVSRRSYAPAVLVGSVRQPRSSSFENDPAPAMCVSVSLR